MKFKELQKLMNDVDSIKYGDDEILVIIRSSKRMLEFDIKSLEIDENHNIWYIEVEP